MNASIQLSDEARPAVREALVASLVAYNMQESGTRSLTEAGPR